MKLTELENYSRTDEMNSFGSAFIQAATGKSFGDLKTGTIQNTFIRDFVDDAMVGLGNAIKSGLVDPNAEGGTPQQVDPNTVQPQQQQQRQPQQQQQRQQQGQQSKAAQQKQSIQRLNNYVKKMSQTINATNDVQQKMKLVKELVNVMADRKDYPEWNNAKGTVEKVVKQSGVDAGFAGSAIKRLGAGQTMTEALQIYLINKLLEYTDMTWEDIGLVVLKENNNYYLADRNQYLFESLLNEQTGKSVTQWVTDWYKQYMKGIDYSEYQGKIDQLINNVKWPARQAKKALTTLAQASWSIAKEKGADKVDGQQGGQGGGQGGGQQFQDMSFEDVKQELSQLTKLEKNNLAKMIEVQQ